MSRACSPPTWPRRPGAARIGPASWPTTPGSPPGWRCGVRSPLASTAPGRRWARWRPSWCDSAEEAVEPLRDRHGHELEELAAAAAQIGRPRGAGAQGDRGPPAPGRAALAHRRAPSRVGDAGRRLPRPLRGAGRGGSAAGSGTTGGDARLRELAGAVAAVEDVAIELVRNPNETLMLESLLVRLSGVSA